MSLTNLTAINSVRSALLCSALAAPSFMPMAAFAQDQADACLQLQSAGDQIDFQDSGISQDQFAQVAQGNDPQQCQALLDEVNTALGVEGEVTQTEQARVRLEDEVVIEGRAIIDQDRPSVQVEEQPVEVIVGNSSSDVNVSQGQIDIVIRQGAPTISFDMPQPTITITQPAPEIIITMPDPSVDVANARPRVEVRQGEPRIQVTVAEPTIELELYQATDPENSPGIEILQREREAGAAEMEPEIVTSRAEAQITYQDDEQQQANVTVSREEPVIRFEQAEPQVEITSAGEPQINWIQSGEAVVRYQEAGAGEQSDQAMNQQDPQTAMTAETPSDPAQDQAIPDQSAQAADAHSGGPNVRREGYESIPAAQIEATDLEGASVFGVQGTDITQIGALMIDQSAADTVIVDVGTYLGTDVRLVRVPVSDLTLLRSADNGDVRVYIDASEDRLMAYPEAG